MLTISKIKAANKAAGHHFFDRATMRFFQSRIERGLYQGKGGVFFITSEQIHEDGRTYSVRQFDPATGHVTTLQGGVAEYSDAHTLGRKAAGAR